MELTQLEQAVTWALTKLGRAFPASFTEADAAAARAKLYQELLAEHGWITAPVWAKAINWVCWHHQGDYVPVPAKVLDACREAKHELERTTERAALPAPERHPSRPDPVAFAWNVAIGRARARKRFALIDAYRKANGLDKHQAAPESVWRGLDEPTEAEIRDVAGEAMPPMAAAMSGGPAWPGVAERGEL